MSINIAINGFGRIGRNILRALYESGLQKKIKVVAINDLAPADMNAHLLKYDSVHGQFHEEVRVEGNSIVLGGQHIAMYAERDPAALPWEELKVDVVLECTGFFASAAKSQAHLQAGAKKVLISAPAGSDVKTIVYGVNHNTLTAEDTIVSNASCTTNCLAPVVKVLHEHFGIERGLMTTVHAYTNDQRLTDSMHKDIRRARSATHSMIPTKTGAAAAVGLVLPELNGRLDGFAIRVPCINVSMVDLSVVLAQQATVDSINQALAKAASGELQGILAYNDLPLVSIDFNHNPHSSVYDATQTRVMGSLVKVLSWYDNEWGFSNRMLDTTQAMMEAK